MCHRPFEDKVSVLQNISVKSQACDGAIGDINGDGIQDIVLGFPNTTVKQGKNSYNGKVKVHLSGGRRGFDVVTLTGQIVEELQTSRFGYQTLVTDIDNDGYEDVIISDPNACNEDFNNAGRVYVYAGGPNFDSTPVLTIYGGWFLDI